MKISKSILLWCELVFLYIGLPLLLFYNLNTIRAINGGGSFLIIILPLMAISMFVFLRNRQQINAKELFQTQNALHHLSKIVIVFFVFAIITTAAVYFWKPNLLFKIPKENPLLWLLIIIFYPLLSVFSQGMIYRVFFFKRYDILFSKKWMVLVSACCFSFGHIIFGNYIAPLLTLFGGIIFAWRYQQTNSWVISNFEHALYGVWLFTVGLGQFLYSGS